MEEAISFLARSTKDGSKKKDLIKRHLKTIEGKLDTNSIKNNQQGIFIYNFFKSTEVTLNPDEFQVIRDLRFITFKDFKSIILPYTLMEPAYYFSQCNTFLEYVSTALHNKWFELNLFRENTLIYMFCQLMMKITKKRCKVSLAEAKNTNTKQNRDELRIFTQNGQIVEFMINDIHVSNLTDDNDFVEKLYSTFNVEFETEIDNTNDVMLYNDLDIITWKVFTNLDFPNCENDKINRTINILGSQMRENRDVNGYKAGVEEVLLHNNHLYLQFKPNSIKFDLKSSIKWYKARETNDLQSWLPEIAEYSYKKYLIQNYDSNLYCKNKFNELYLNKSPKDVDKELNQQELQKFWDNLSIFNQKIFEKNFLKKRNFTFQEIETLQEILDDYPEDMNLVIPRVTKSVFLSKLTDLFPSISKMNKNNLKDVYSKIERETVNENKLKIYRELRETFENTQNLSVNYKNVFEGSEMFKKLTDCGLKFYEIRKMFSSKCSTIPISHLIYLVANSYNVNKKMNDICQTVYKFTFMENHYDEILEFISDNNITDLNVFMEKMYFISETNFVQKYYKYFDDFVAWNLPNFFDKNHLIVEDFYKFLEQESSETISKVNDLLSEENNAEKSQKILDLSLRFNELLTPFLENLLPPMCKNAGNIIEYEKEPVYNIIKSVKDFLTFNTNNLKTYELVYLEQYNLRVSNKVNNKFWRYSKGKIFMFCFDNKYSKDDFLFENGNPDYITLKLPIINASKKLDLQNLQKIQKQILALNQNSQNQNFENLIKSKISKSDSSQPLFVKCLEYLDIMKTVKVDVDKYRAINDFKSSVSKQNEQFEILDLSEMSLFIDELEGRILSNFSKIDLTIPNIITIQEKPLEILIRTNLNNPKIKIKSEQDNVKGFMSENMIKLQIPVKEMGLGYNQVNFDLFVNDIQYPFNLNLGKIESQVYIYSKGFTFYYNKENNVMCYNPKFLAEDNPLTVRTFGTDLSPIDHKLQFFTDNKPSTEFDNDEKVTAILPDTDPDYYMNVLVSKDLSCLIFTRFEKFDRPFITKYFNRMAGKFEEMPEYLYAGTLGFRYYFYINTPLKSSKDKLTVQLDPNDDLQIKDMKYSDDHILLFDLSFSRHCDEESQLKIIISTDKKEFVKEIPISVIPFPLNIIDEGDDVCIEAEYSELDDYPFVYYDEVSKKWLPIKTNEPVPKPTYKFVVCTLNGYYWRAFNTEYNIETNVDFSKDSCFPENVTNYCYFVVYGNSYQIVMENEYDPSRMKRVAVRLCDEPYHPNEPDTVWVKTWAPISDNLDYLNEIFKDMKFKDFVRISDELYKFLKVNPDDSHFSKKMNTKYSEIKKVGDGKGLIKYMNIIFADRLKFFRQNRYQLRLPIKLDEIFAAQKSMTTKHEFNPWEVKQWNNMIEQKQNEMNKIDFQEIENEDSNEVIQFTKESVSLLSYNDIQVKEEPEIKLDIGEVDYVFEDLESLTIPQINDLDDNFYWKSIILCKKYPFVVRKHLSEYDKLPNNAFHIYSFLYELYQLSKMIKTDIANEFIRCFEFMTLQVGDDQEKYQNSIVLPSAVFGDEKEEKEDVSFSEIPNEKTQEIKNYEVQDPIPSQQNKAENQQFSVELNQNQQNTTNLTHNQQFSVELNQKQQESINQNSTQKTNVPNQMVNQQMNDVNSSNQMMNSNQFFGQKSDLQLNMNVQNQLQNQQMMNPNPMIQNQNSNMQMMNQLMNQMMNTQNPMMNPMNQMNQMNPMNQMNQSNPMNQNQMSQINQMMSLLNQMNPMNQMNQMNPMNQMNQMNPMNQNQMNPMNQMNQMNPMNQNQMNPMNQNQMNPMNQNQMNPMNQNQMNPMNQNQMNPMNQNQMNPMNQNQMNPMNQNQMNQLNQSQMNQNQMNPMNPMNQMNQNQMNQNQMNQNQMNQNQMNPMNPMNQNQMNPMNQNQMNQLNQSQMNQNQMNPLNPMNQNQMNQNQMTQTNQNQMYPMNQNQMNQNQMNQNQMTQTNQNQMYPMNQMNQNQINQNQINQSQMNPMNPMDQNQMNPMNQNQMNQLNQSQMNQNQMNPMNPMNQNQINQNQINQNQMNQNQMNQNQMNQNQMNQNQINQNQINQNQMNQNQMNPMNQMNQNQINQNQINQNQMNQNQMNPMNQMNQNQINQNQINQTNESKPNESDEPNESEPNKPKPDKSKPDESNESDKPESDESNESIWFCSSTAIFAEFFKQFIATKQQSANATAKHFPVN
ncbi:enzymatic polyprotein-related family [Trichomonas vaginalis G3]|uniref:enzymatic polyprotein-related family n=1 Tax=Trichomonas vaginalis (strain ATCC PRA-98 / G3) TaxID=412133 RepID=UPI0021E5FDBF|nr:enzymatic polyprotein-related family [Trichomonas vaginalis G3]KAI5506808.1 enzymatic polyprotein-related family [Trichomonas vaginalis G3]